ncbi:CoA transferase [Phenylobacterium sp.]|uniref:CoA transferase n=1 Tax=Phenylobacterium sp. TaxID=1871053 RepID=UPI00301CD436
MLADVRVLEVSVPETMLAGQILGDLGADVIALEPPSGAAGRRLGPYVDGQPGLERSLSWHALNRNKRGATLALSTADGRAIFKAILDKVDVLIAPAEIEPLLNEAGPPEDLVVCLISQFSRDGPKAAYKATDPVIMAASSAPSLAGPPDRPPTFFPTPQSIMEAGAEAAVAALSALAARDRLGGGQTVDLQARIAAMPAALGRLVSGRAGDKPSSRQRPGPIGLLPPIPAMYACKDGFAYVSLSFSAAFAPMTQRMVQWLADEGALASDLAAVDLAAVAREASLGRSPPDPIPRIIEVLRETLVGKTKAEIAEIAHRYRFMAAPVMTMADIAHFAHFRERGLFAPQRVGSATVDVPARFAQYSDYEIEVRRPAPALSEHTVQVLSDLAGLSRTEVQALFEQGIV